MEPIPKGGSMEAFDETLDRIARGGEAVFAVDGSNRIILWNKACEDLIGRPARHVLGKRCHEVVGGRDSNGNLYCHASCPVAHQARDRRDDPVRRFELDVAAGDGSRRTVSTSMFAIPSYHPALTTVVHVLRPAARPASAAAPAGEREPLAPLTARGESVALTPREKEILGCLAGGQTTVAIAKALSIARVTVRNHVQSILQKLNVHSKLAAVVAARRGGLLPTG
jgi:DNA-binding CsgD family transcriptional regulator